MSADTSGTIDTAEKLHWRLFRLTSSFRRRDQEQIAAGNLTLTQCSMLYTLRVHGPLRIGELAALEKVTAPTTTQAVRRLEDLGLAERRRDINDQRIMRIVITDEGIRLQQEALREFLDVIMSELTVSEISALERALAPLDRLSQRLHVLAVRPNSAGP